MFPSEIQRKRRALPLPQLSLARDDKSHIDSRRVGAWTALVSHFQYPSRCGSLFRSGWRSRQNSRATRRGAMRRKRNSSPFQSIADLLLFQKEKEKEISLFPPPARLASLSFSNTLWPTKPRGTPRRVSTSTEKVKKRPGRIPLSICLRRVSSADGPAPGKRK